MSTARAALDEKTPASHSNADANAQPPDSKSAGSLRVIPLHVPLESSALREISFFADGSSIFFSREDMTYNDDKRYWQTVSFRENSGNEIGQCILPNRKYAISWSEKTIYIIEISSMKCQRVLFHSFIYNIVSLPSENHVLIFYKSTKEQSPEKDTKSNTPTDTSLNCEYQIWDITNPFHGKLKLQFDGNPLVKTDSPGCYHLVKQDITNGVYVFTFFNDRDGNLTRCDAWIKTFYIHPSGKAIEIVAMKLNDFLIEYTQLLGGFLILIGTKANQPPYDTFIQIWDISNVYGMALREEFPVKGYKFIDNRHPVYLNKKGNLAIGRHNEIHSSFLYEVSPIFQTTAQNSLRAQTHLLPEIINLILKYFSPNSPPPIKFEGTPAAPTFAMHEWKAEPVQSSSLASIREEKETLPVTASKKTLEAVSKLILFIKRTQLAKDYLESKMDVLEQLIKDQLALEPIQINEKDVAFIVLEVAIKFFDKVIILFLDDIPDTKIINFVEIDMIKSLIIKYYPEVVFEASEKFHNSLMKAIFSKSYDASLIQAEEKDKPADTEKRDTIADSATINAVRNLSRYAKSKTSFWPNISCFQDPQTNKNAAFSKIDLDLKTEEEREKITLFEKDLATKAVEIFNIALTVRAGITNKRTDSAEAIIKLLSGKIKDNEIITNDNLIDIDVLLAKYSRHSITHINDYETLKKFVEEIVENLQDKVSVKPTAAR